MGRRLRVHLTYANVMSSVAVVLALGGGAYAATGGVFTSASGLINGCVPQRGGPLVVLRHGKTCPKGDVSLPFNQRGPAGMNGTNGTSGTNGTNGINGMNGVAGGPGPAASAAATSNTFKSFGAVNGDVEVKRTTITTAFTGRIVANGSFEVQRSSGNGEVRCTLRIASNGSSSFTNISQTVDAAFPSLSGSSFDVEIPLTGGAVEPAGTYAIRGICGTASSAGFFFGDLTAVAAAH